MRNIFRLCALALISCAMTLAQVESGSLSGKVTDNTGAPAPNSIIILTNTATNVTQRVVTGSDGTFSITGLQPGTYKVEMEAAGGRRAGAQPIEIRAGAPSQIEVQFGEPVSGAPGTVEIRATASLAQTDSAEVSRSYSTDSVRSLPVLDRQWEELIGLMPGVTPPVTSGDVIADPQRTRIFNVNGQPAFTNGQYQDGALNDEMATGSTMRIQPNESVQALQVRTSNYNAEYGFAGGSWSNTVTRPGTQKIHGSLFEFHTNNFLAARNPVAPANGSDPRFTRNQFGGTIGGPAIPGRMFWFFSYDGLIRRGRELAFATVPNEALRSGNFSGFPGLTLFNPATGSAATGANRLPFPNNTIPSAQFDPAARAILNQIPLPNQEGLVNNFAGNVPLEDDNHRFDGKLDHRFSDKTYGFLRYGFTMNDVTRGALLGPLGSGADAGLRNHNAVLSISHNIGTSLLGELRFGYGRYRNAIVPAADLSGFTSDLASVGFTAGIPQNNIGGFGQFGPNNYPPLSIDNSYNPSTNWVWHSGMHNLKFGFDVRHILADGFFTPAFSPAGSFTFGPGGAASPSGTVEQTDLAASSFASFLVGAPTQAGVANFLARPGARQTQWAGYVTDTVNLWQKLYLELGLRYDVYSPLRPRPAGSASFFDPAANTLTAFNTGSIDEFGNRDYDWNNVAPRIGIAFRPFGRLVFRGGYALQYFPEPFLLSGLNFASQGVQAGVAGGFTTVPFRVPAAAMQTGDTAPNQPLFTTSTNNVTPYVQTFSAMVQGDIPYGIVADIGYVGTLGRQLPFSRALAAQPGTGIAGLPFASSGRTANTTEIGTGLTNNYNSLQINATKRLAAGLSFSAAYTWSKALDYGYNLLDPFNRALNYGPADWDRANIFSLSHVWRLPFGAGQRWANSGMAARWLADWEINGIMRWASGTPFTVTADPLFCACPGVSAVTANVSGPVSTSGSSSFDPSQFSAPGAAGFGNLGRNVLRNDGMFVYNLSLFRNFTFRENQRIELRGEAYNLTNTANYINPIAMVGAPGAGTSFGTFNGIGGRQFQVVARWLF